MECQRTVTQVKPFLGEVIGLIDQVEIGVFHVVYDLFVCDKQPGEPGRSGNLSAPRKLTGKTSARAENLYIK